MSRTTPKPRPMSPFMIGPYYKPQLTSMLSITHRGMGVFLTAGSLLLVWWLLAIAAGPEEYARFAALADGLFGRLVLVALAFGLIYHFFNGIRHMVWDIGKGLDIPSVYASGWLMLVSSIVVTAVVVFLAFGGAA